MAQRRQLRKKVKEDIRKSPESSGSIGRVVGRGSRC